MVALLSRLDLYEIGRQYVLSRATRIEPTMVDVVGSDINLFVGSQSYVAHAVVRQLGEEINNLLLDGCDTDDAIDRLAFDRYQQIRKGAGVALGTVDFTRPTAASGAGSIPVGTKLITLDGIEYVTYSVANFAASGTGSLSASAFVRAAKAGKDSQAGANTIRRFDKIGLLWDQTLQVNNSLPTAGGEPAETIDAFRERIRLFFVASKRGTLAAIEFGAKQVVGVDSAQAVESVESDGTPARIVRLFIADSSGIASVALAAQVSSQLLEYRAGGIYVLVETSSPTIVPVELRLVFRAGVDTVGLRDQVRGAVIELVNSLGVNLPLEISALYAVLARFRSDGLLVSAGTLVFPTGDVQPEPGFTIRTTASSVTIQE